jgi:thiol-disulfide isomerase/thioredoxin
VVLSHHEIMRFSLPWILLLVAAAHADIVDDVRTTLASNAITQADAQLASYRAQHGVTPEYLEANSWMAREHLRNNNLDQADAYARKTEQLAIQQLKTRKLDADQHLPTALGAAIEVEAQVLAANGKPALAVALLKKNLLSYRNTSIRNRLQKNLNLLALVGKPAPPLQLTEHLGPKPVALSQLKGSPVLLFFWAHWCLDCKGEAPILATLRSEYASKGLAVIAPTQRYGYAAGGESATPAAELAYIKQVHDRYYSALADVPVPVSQENFSVYGASTTPTLVLLDRAGKVAFYHPGALPYQELKAAIERAFVDHAVATRSP